jgi:RNA-directed DNA polymerase
MMHGHEKSDSAIVATKPPNKAGRPAAEAVERRAEAKENANRCRTCRTQCRESVSPAPERVREGRGQPSKHPRWEPYAGKLHVRFYAGGAQ